MKISPALYRFLPLVSFTTLVLGGCALNHTDRTILANHGVPVPLQAKMKHLAPLTLPEIAELSQKGMLPEFINEYIRGSHARYDLSDHDISWLNHQKVNSSVIAFMYATPATMALASDRASIIDWPPYFSPFYGGSLNVFGEETYLSEGSQLQHSQASADPTLVKQQEDMQDILEKKPSPTPR